MKKYVMILFMLTGFLNYSHAQVFKHREKHEGAEKYTKVKPHAQMYHFEKQDKDKKLAHNGSNYKKPRHYKVDGDGFTAYQPYRKDRNLFILPDKSKRYQKKMKRMMYAVR